MGSEFAPMRQFGMLASLPLHGHYLSNMPSESSTARLIQSPASRRTAVAISIATVLFGAGIAAYVLHFPALYGIDDAQITQVYGRNIAEGYGYVYYAGGERVEGSTSLLWTMINVVLFMATPTPQLLLLATSLAITLMTVFGMIQITAALAEASRASATALVAGLALVTLDLNFFVWSVWSFMDEGLYICIITLIIAATMRLDEDRSRRSVGILAALFALAPISRPEGIFVCAALSGSMALLSALSGRRALALIFLVCGAIAATSFGAATAFRLAYFGYPLPNTFYAKVSLDLATTLIRGAKYTAHGFIGVPLLALGFALGGILAISCVRDGLARRSFAGFHSAAAIVVTCAAVIVTTVLEGGDHFNGARLLQPIAPACAALIGLYSVRLMPTLFDRAARPVVGACSALLLLAGATAWYPRSGQSLIAEFQVGAEARNVGRTMNEISALFGPTSIGVIVAGGTPLEFRGKVYDIEGLNWVEMAHAARVKSGPAGHDSFDAKVIYRTLPDIMHLLQQDPAAPTVASFTTAATKDVASEARFREFYVPVRFDLSTGPYQTFASRAWLTRIPRGAVAELTWSSVKIRH